MPPVSLISEFGFEDGLTINIKVRVFRVTRSVFP
jgi:hypothetical protein